MNKILIIQTAFIGDVVLATPLVAKMKSKFPYAQIHFLVRNGNEILLQNDTRISKILVWDKKKSKIPNFLTILKDIRNEKYDLVINVHRFLSSGLFTIFSKAKTTVGFDKNPLSFFYSKKIKHQMAKGIHEVDRNLKLIADWVDVTRIRPEIILSNSVLESTKKYKNEKYIVIAPCSVWFTKQYPIEKWVHFIKTTTFGGNIYLIGAKTDHKICEEIILNSENKRVFNLCGQLNLLESVALIKDATMNYVNDSAPLHFASSQNAPTTAVFCSTTPEFGFFPLSDQCLLLEYPKKLNCKPCGLHGFKECPEKHFHCSDFTIN